ncbi:MarR family winged helix-turn-helix transcriptional regulator [Zunongwangia endophytica]|uniref:MarR family winged helix-turn-helix transcriptional regulator n=1 Tax=Zunongwangia endophytica TaxID=1808945 RepID=A0ABV8H6A3_9FLAO|nr:MarR family transcriptional regulator [Zunongwangia endophytica]MDN3596587.1 MarR family transcriptional regulator [Zunongwangia endophytica]
MKVEKLIQTEHKLSENKKFAINVLLCASKVTTMMGDVLKPYDVSMQQFNVLRILRGQKGNPANLNTIQERMVNKMSNTTRLVDKLIKKNLVQRHICEQNRRKVEIAITEDGLALLDKLDPLVEQVENDFAESLSEEELVLLNTSLEKIRT